jgi:hypothetical protein
LLKQVENPKEVLLGVCHERNLDFEMVCRTVALLPLRWIVGCLTVDRPVIPLFQSFSSSPGHLKYFCLLFGHIQMMFGLCSNKDGFLQMIATVFGLFEPMRTVQRSVIDIIFINFISTLLCDRAFFTNGELDWLINSIITYLKDADCTIRDIEYFISPDIMTENPIAGQLRRIACIKQDCVSLLDDSNWHIAQCWRFESQFENLLSISERNSDVLLPFPIWKEAAHIDMNQCFRSRYFFAILFDFLHHQLTQPSLAVHYALNLFILSINQTCALTFETQQTVIVADSIETLAANISDNFREFIQTPISYKLGVPSTIVQIIEKLGPLGSNCLVQSKIHPPQEPKEFEEPKQQSEKSIPSTRFGRCGVCGRSKLKDSLFGYPTICFTSALSSFIENVSSETPLVSTRQFFCCTHKVHVDCLQQNIGRCPVCDHFRNCIMPAFSDNMNEFDSPAVFLMVERFTDSGRNSG